MYFDGIRMALLGSFFSFFQCFLKYHNFDAQNLDFQPNLRQEVNTKKLYVQPFYWPNFYQKLDFFGFCYCSTRETEIVQFFVDISAFIGMKFQDYLEKTSFGYHFAEFWRNSSFFYYKNTTLMTILGVLTTSHSLFSSTVWNIKTDWEYISAGNVIVQK